MSQDSQGVKLDWIVDCCGRCTLRCVAFGLGELCGRNGKKMFLLAPKNGGRRRTALRQRGGLVR